MKNHIFKKILTKLVFVSLTLCHTAQAGTETGNGANGKRAQKRPAGFENELPFVSIKRDTNQNQISGTQRALSKNLLINKVNLTGSINTSTADKDFGRFYIDTKKLLSIYEFPADEEELKNLLSLAEGNSRSSFSTIFGANNPFNQYLSNRSSKQNYIEDIKKTLTGSIKTSYPIQRAQELINKTRIDLNLTVNEALQKGACDGICSAMDFKNIPTSGISFNLVCKLAQDSSNYNSEVYDLGPAIRINKKTENIQTSLPYINMAMTEHMRNYFCEHPEQQQQEFEIECGLTPSTKQDYDMAYEFLSFSAENSFCEYGAAGSDHCDRDTDNLFKHSILKLGAKEITIYNENIYTDTEYVTAAKNLNLEATLSANTELTGGEFRIPRPIGWGYYRPFQTENILGYEFKYDEYPNYVFAHNEAEFADIVRRTFIQAYYKTFTK